MPMTIIFSAYFDVMSVHLLQQTMDGTACCVTLQKYVARHLVKEDSTGTTEHRDIQEKAETVDPNDDLLLSAVEEPPCNRVAYQSIPNANSINLVMPEEAGDIVNMSDDEPLLSIQTTESIDDESKALDMLLSCTPEYFALAYTNKLKNPKKDRHGIKFMCLCQYLEKADKDFRKKVKTMKSLSRTRNIEEDKMKINT